MVMFILLDYTLKKEESIDVWDKASFIPLQVLNKGSIWRLAQASRCSAHFREEN